MRTTMALDDDLVAKAQDYTDKSALVREALRSLVEREAAHRVTLLGGSDPEAAAASRRRLD